MTRFAITAGLALIAILPAVSAQAQAPRTFVSAAGSDSNPCSFAAPCRHFQAAVNATSAGGEVDALDPAGYGPITISQGVTIEGQGWSYIAPPANGNGITINAVSGNVTIHGVSINGAGINGGTNGIVFNAGGSLTVTNCVLQNFVYSGSGATTGNGILMQPSSGAFNFSISNTTASNNGLVGVFYLPPAGSTAIANGILDRVVATDDLFSGLEVNTSLGGGAATVSIFNSIANKDGSSGIYVLNASAALTVAIDNVAVSSNGDGIRAGNTANVYLGRSVVTANSGGIDDMTIPNTFYSYGDNHISGNILFDVFTVGNTASLITLGPK